jgi:radical SAM protein (TIGR04043 family)/putative N-acetyltransferase (TIGR04045 family)
MSVISRGSMSGVSAALAEEQSALLTDLQALGLAAGDDAPGVGGRRGGAGPSDHRAVSLGSTTIMVPMRPAGRSPFRLRVLTEATRASAGAVGASAARVELLRDDRPVAALDLPAAPRFYALSTADGIPYSKIALLHARRVLASTVIQSCVRYNDPAQACQFCAIGTSMKEGRTLARKTPAQLAEVAEAALRLDGVEQLVLTTGTPATPDRGAAHLAACAAAVKAATPGLPIQVQCEPPDDFAWFARLKEAGADALGMHLEAVEPAVRAAVMPGKAQIPVAYYLDAFAAAVKVFGRGQVSTYLIAGLGDAPASLLEISARLVALGVYPFVVPFVPLAGTPMADRPPPPASQMQPLYVEVARLLRAHGVGRHEGRMREVRRVLGPGLVRGALVTAPASARSPLAPLAGEGDGASPFVCRVAQTEGERAAYFALRRAIFCDEQRLFAGSDRDAIDEAAVPVVCLARSTAAGGGEGRVVGVVRLWEEASGDWWGGRLGVEPAHRTVGAIGKWLIQTAVGSARAWGAWRFRATVQRANVPLFRRLHWQTRTELDVLGQPHHLMEADLSRYARTAEIRPVGAAALGIPALDEEPRASDAA